MGQAGDIKRSKELLSLPQYHRHALQQTKPCLAFEKTDDAEGWQKKLRAKLTEILCLPDKWDRDVNSDVVFKEKTKDYTSYSVNFRAEQKAVVPGYLLKPRKTNPPFPVMICLQGHRKGGMCVSIGQKKTRNDLDFAIQAVQNGWAALAIEQRGFGERAAPSCSHEALNALMLGKTLLGERVFDVMRAIDFIRTQPDLDMERIGCMGNSMGGTVAFYAACVDPRIRLAVVSCSFCTYADSWMKFPHCACGYLPGILQYADMGDIGGLIAPRSLVIVAGKYDPIASLSGVRKAFERTNSVFSAMGYEKNLFLLIGDGGHKFYPDLAWPKISAIKNRWKP
ncbi:Alpha/beta hydrolase fold-containing protein [Desulfonema magnum]|uniref:Alpha/beta hydrolase fold-containing protein n=2 Tax=Desulfonema magnum TaxID=45655 RepID=A0A975BI81_9BACT|nr:Alpha/beta hydrolase fold-containing protein [Desulfonema magnum]